MRSHSIVKLTLGGLPIRDIQLQIDTSVRKEKKIQRLPGIQTNDFSQGY